jgi:hypothetical protein
MPYISKRRAVCDAARFCNSLEDAGAAGDAMSPDQQRVIRILMDEKGLSTIKQKRSRNLN